MVRLTYFMACLTVFYGSTVLAAEIRGVITRIDHEKKELVLEARGLGVRGTVFVFTLDNNSRIIIGQQPGQFNMLTPGKPVRVTFDTRDGKNIIQTLRANPLQGILAKPKPLPAAAMPVDPNTVAGKLLRVGFTDREIIVIGPGPKGVQTETTLRVPEKVKITRAGKDIKLEDLKEGEQVAVRHQKRDGRLTAESIQVGAGVAGAAAQPPPFGKNEPFISRLRQALKMADQFLEMAEKGGLQLPGE